MKKPLLGLSSNWYRQGKARYTENIRKKGNEVVVVVVC